MKHIFEYWVSQPLKAFESNFSAILNYFDGLIWKPQKLLNLTIDCYKTSAPTLEACNQKVILVNDKLISRQFE